MEIVLFISVGEKNMNKSLGTYNIIDKDGICQSIQNVLVKNIDYNTYTSPKGLKELRIEISHFLSNTWNYSIPYENMLITTGSQQSIHLITNTLVQENDYILVEEPTYYGAIDSFKKRNVQLLGIPIHEDGPNMDEMEKIIQQTSPKIIYVIPTFHNPTGYCWTIQKRKEFLKLINQYNILVIEDDPYSLIHFHKKRVKSLYELNHGKNIIYIGTFSKIISPSIKVGYIICDKEILNKLFSMKKAFDLCTNTFIQHVVLDYLKTHDLNQIISNKIRIYKKLLQKSIQDLEENYKDQILYYSHPKGGLFFLVKFKKPVNEEEFEDGSHYYINKNDSSITRINICSQL